MAHYPADNSFLKSRDRSPADLSCHFTKSHAWGHGMKRRSQGKSEAMKNSPSDPRLMDSLNPKKKGVNYRYIRACLILVTAVSVFITLSCGIQLRRRQVFVKDPAAESLSLFNHDSPLKLSDSGKPLLILHVGPPKTSSTTLQSMLTRYRETLKLDNYLYVGRIYDEEGNYEGFEEGPFLDLSNAKCHVELEDIYEDNEDDKSVDWTHHEDAPQCWKNFLVELARVRRSNMNLIISDEKLCLRGHNSGKFHYELLKETLRDWDVRVLTTYRRYFAWLPSHKNHHDSHKLTESDYQTWDGEELTPIFPRLQECMQDLSKLRYPYIDAVVGNYSKYFPVEVMNMHDTTEYPTLASQFVCKYVPNAEETCELSLREGDIASNVELNKAKSIFYDMLAMAAYKQGIIRSSVGSRVSVRDAIQHEHEVIHGKTPSELPLDCPDTKSVERVLEKSLGYEMAFFPEFHHGGLGENVHRSDFWTMVDKKRFCSVDIAKTLRQKEWIEFFDKLNRQGQRRMYGKSHTRKSRTTS